MTEVLTALITLVGTLLVAGLGFWQWRRSQASDQRVAYRARRIEALKAMWDAVSNIEEDLRRQAMTDDRSDAYAEHVRSTNFLLLRSAPFLQEDEKLWCVASVENLIAVDFTVRRMHRPTSQVLEWWTTSALQPPESFAVANAGWDLGRAQENLAERYAAVMRGDHD